MLWIRALVPPIERSGLIMVKKRESSVEVYRCCLMFGICMLHAVNFSECGYAWLKNIFMPCVDAFVFISGWFGCRFSFMKIIRLWGLGLICAAVMTFLLVIDGMASTNYDGFLLQVLKMFKSYWFFFFYLVVLLVSPIINPLFERKFDQLVGHKVLLTISPFLILAFGWSLLSTFRICATWLPIPSGLGSYTPLTLIGVYVVARYCRWSGCLGNIPVRLRVLALLLAILGSAVGLGRYSSPIAVIVAAFSFSLFTMVEMPKAIGRMATFMGPSMFSIYLLQTNDFGIAVIKTVPQHISTPVSFFVTASILFFGGLAIDVVRRLVVQCLRVGFQCMREGR